MVWQPVPERVNKITDKRGYVSIRWKLTKNVLPLLNLTWKRSVLMWKLSLEVLNGNSNYWKIWNFFLNSVASLLMSGSYLLWLQRFGFQMLSGYLDFLTQFPISRSRIRKLGSTAGTFLWPLFFTSTMWFDNLYDWLYWPHK